ncbi:MAG: protein-L-isoaspartate O-methyltransferase [Candidatus Nanohaloarchaea archaeon]
MDSNQELVDYLVRSGRIEDPDVERAFRDVDRARFIPEGRKQEAYRDHAVPIGHDVTVSAPHMVAVNTEMLEVEPGNTVLEIGSGSGYQAAVLAELAEKVVGVERVRDLVERSRRALAGYDNVEIVHGNGLEAVQEEFDRILFSCAIDSMEPAKKYLREEGVMVAPVKKDGGQVMQKYRDGETETGYRVRFVDYVDEPVD